MPVPQKDIGDFFIWKSLSNNQELGITTLHSELRTQHSALSTQHSKLST
ncbi:hypothetical protein [Dulcicalothrix desertica]|nr:hypothetical protein [Dulcicalothrix desertica]